MSSRQLPIEACTKIIHILGSDSSPHAYTHSRLSIRTLRYLTLLNHTFLAIATPVLYRLVTIDRHNISAFYRTVCSSDRGTFLASLVKKLLVQELLWQDDVDGESRNDFEPAAQILSKMTRTLQYLFLPCASLPGLLSGLAGSRGFPDIPKDLSKSLEEAVTRLENLVELCSESRMFDEMLEVDSAAETGGSRLVERFPRLRHVMTDCEAATAILRGFRNDPNGHRLPSLDITIPRAILDNSWDDLNEVLHDYQCQLHRDLRLILYLDGYRISRFADWWIGKTDEGVMNQREKWYLARPVDDAPSRDSMNFFEELLESGVCKENLVRVDAHFEYFIFQS